MSSDVLAPNEISYEVKTFFLRKDRRYLPCKYSGVRVWVKCTHGLRPATPVLHPSPYFC